MKNILKTIGFGLFIFIICVPALWPLLNKGFFEPHDLHHLADIYEMTRALRLGQFPPRLGPDFLNWYGYPLFNFYYVLPFYVGAFWYTLTGVLTDSLKFVFIVCGSISVVGMYLMLRQFVGKFSSFIGAFIFLYTPYRAVQIYVRGAVGEAMATALLPLVIWALVRLVKEKNPKFGVATAIAVTATFILSHNYMWALSLPCVGLIIVLLLLQSNEKAKKLFKLIFAGVISLGITAYWWLPALIEQKLVSSVTPFPLIDHFPFIKQLIIPSWGYGSSVWGPGDGLSFQIGVVNLAVVLMIIIFTTIKKVNFKEKKLKLLTIWALVGFVVAVLLMNSRTYPLWKIMPFHDFVQFPWRLLFLTTFFTAVLSGVLVETVSKKHRRIFGVVLITVAMGLTVSYFQPSKIVNKSDQEYLNRFFNSPATYSEDYLLLPSWVSVRPPKNKGPEIHSADANIGDIENFGMVWKATYSSQKDSEVYLEKVYFPGWKATVDGFDIPVKPSGDYGLVTIDVPAGVHNLEFHWSEVQPRSTADYVSIFSILLLIGLLVKEIILPIRLK